MTIWIQHLPTANEEEPEKTFITTGKENRDFTTLLKAFAETGLPLDVFTTPAAGDKNYELLLKNIYHIPTYGYISRAVSSHTSSPQK